MSLPHDLPGLGEAVMAAADAAGIAIALVTHEPTGPRTTFVNDAALRITGRTRDELLTQPLIDFVEPESHERLLELSRARRDGRQGPTRIDVTVIRPDGKRVPIVSVGAQISLGGNPTAFTFFWDVSERVEAERGRLAEAQRLASVVEAAPDGVALVRGPSILHINAAGARMLGFSDPAKAVGVSLADLMLPEEVPMMLRRMQAAAHGQPQPSQVYRVRRADGTTISADVSSIPFEHEGKPALLAFVRDVTERAQLQEQMARAERLAALSTLAAGLAHEVNNPLTAAMLQLDVIEQHATAAMLPGVTTDVFERIKELRKTHERIASVMRDFAAFARVGDSRRERVDLKQVIASVERMLAPLLLRKSARYVNAVDQLPLIEADPSRLEQVFLNLMLNAVQALPEGRSGNEVRVGGRVLPDGRVCIDIVDNGVGITTENLRRVFDPFFTTKPVGVGTGLGLTVCHNIVSSYGGELEVDSVSGHGCTMRVLLPVNAPGVAAVAGRTRVMIVDDEPHLATTLRLLLQDRHEVMTHTQSETAVRILLDGAPVDVVLCDLMMPDPNGIEVFRRVTEGRPDLKDRFIFMTGGAYTAASQRFFDSNLAPRVEKPFDPEHVERLIASVARR